MPDVVITVDGDQLHVVGADCSGPSLRVFTHQTAANGDFLGGSSKASVAGAEHPQYPPGAVDYTQQLQHTERVVVWVLDESGHELARWESSDGG